MECKDTATRLEIYKEMFKDWMGISTFDKLVRSGEIPSFKLDNRRFFSREVVGKWLKELKKQ